MATLLIVDDEPNILTTLRRALELCHGQNTSLELDRAPGGGARVRLALPAELAA